MVRPRGSMLCWKITWGTMWL